MSHLPASTSWYIDHARRELESFKLCEIASLDFLQASLMEALSQMWSYLLINLSKEHPPGNKKYTMWTWRENVASQNHLSCQKYVREKTGEGRGLNKKEMNFANVSKTKATLGCGNQHRVCDYTFWLWIQKWNLQLSPSLSRLPGFPSPILFFSLCRNSSDLKYCTLHFQKSLSFLVVQSLNKGAYPCRACEKEIRKGYSLSFYPVFIQFQ